MISPKMMEAWLTLVNEAMHGTKDSQDAMRMLSSVSANTSELSQWMMKFMPMASAMPNTPQVEAFQDMLDNWYQGMGVVPRSRYLDLLEKYDKVQRRLEKAEETIAALRGYSETKTQTEEEAKKMLNMWSGMFEETVKTQLNLMKSWSQQTQESQDDTSISNKDTPSQPDPKHTADNATSS